MKTNSTECAREINVLFRQIAESNTLLKKAWLTDRRLDKAKVLLYEAELAMSDLACDCAEHRRIVNAIRSFLQEDPTWDDENESLAERSTLSSER